MKILFKAVARGPGVAGIGASGGGDGDAEVRAGIFSVEVLICGCGKCEMRRSNSR